jgi:mono/diheme cytochrome c family protein
MKHKAALAILLAALAPCVALAQSDSLDEQQRTGRQVLAQSCAVCHLPPVMGARTYGPALSRETAAGNAEVIRGVISNGTPRMPAFKHYLDGTQIDAVIAYLKTVPPATPASTTR